MLAIQLHRRRTGGPRRRTDAVLVATVVSALACGLGLALRLVL